MRVLNVNSANVLARAVAGLTNGDACIYALDRTLSPNSNGFSANGGVQANFGCGVYSNANFTENGASGCVNASSISYTGSYNPATPSSTCNPPSATQGVPVVDPMKNLYPTIPATSPCTYNNYSINGSSAAVVTIPSGVYCGGITITSNSVTDVIFSGGTYVLAGGGLKITSGANITGYGVTFFNMGSPYKGIDITGNGTVTLQAPTSGTYKALLFWQDPSVGTGGAASTIGGGASSAYQGILYFPTTSITYAGNSVNSFLAPTTGAGYTMIVAYDVKISGNTTVSADYSSLAGGTNPLPVAAFAE
jgi:hypothetical protein